MSELREAIEAAKAHRSNTANEVEAINRASELIFGALADIDEGLAILSAVTARQTAAAAAV